MIVSSFWLLSLLPLLPTLGPVVAPVAVPAILVLR